ncbi:MAG: branched-chain amino acid ABC transporter permease [Acidimicrobiaceae bacterium]|nr:branched-chain amino acid ABC transporter permease [Acidimicrobiaceae bacterium]
MDTRMLRGRSLVTSALVVLAVAAALVVASSTSSRVVLSLMAVVFVLSVSISRIPELTQSHPVVKRAALTVALVDVSLLGTYFFSATTNFNLATGAAMSIVLLGLSFLTGASGQISLGNSAFMGVGAFAMAIWANHHTSTPIVISLLIAVVSGALVGLLLGLPATRLRGPYLAGMTLAFAVAFGAILSSFNSWTGGDGGLQLPSAVTPPHWITSLFSSGTALLTPNSMWLADITIVTTGVAFFFMANLFASRTGRAMRLIRDNDVAAELVGVSLPRTRVIAFMVSSSYAALGGALWTLINNSVSPSTYSFALSVTILSLVVIGGIGTIPGALIGGLIYAYSTSVISWITNQTGLNPQGNFASQLNGIIFGVLLIATMLFAPMGISGAVHRAWKKRRDNVGPAT